MDEHGADVSGEMYVELLSPSSIDTDGLTHGRHGGGECSRYRLSTTSGHSQVIGFIAYQDDTSKLDPSLTKRREVQRRSLSAIDVRRRCQVSEDFPAPRHSSSRPA